MIYIEIDVQGFTAILTNEGLAKSVQNRMFKQAHYEMGCYWWDHFLAKHFERSSFAEYGYASRTHAYEFRKAKKKRHRRPLVWSGESEERAKAGTASDHVVSTRDSVTVKLYAPHLSYHNPDSQVFPYLEIKAITTPEQGELARCFGASMRRQFEAIPRRTFTVQADAA